MNTTMFLIIYGITVIVSFTFVIINYKNDHKKGFYIHDATIEHLYNVDRPLIIISLVPIANIIIIVLIVIRLVWDKIKNIKI